MLMILFGILKSISKDLILHDEERPKKRFDIECSYNHKHKTHTHSIIPQQHQKSQSRYKQNQIQKQIQKQHDNQSVLPICEINNRETKFHEQETPRSQLLSPYK